MDDALAAAPRLDYIRAGQTQDNRLSGDIMGPVSSRSAAAVVGAALLLAACTGDPVPKEPDPTATASTSTPSPTPTPPVMPEEAKADTSSGAASFAIYWAEVLDHAAVTGDTRVLRQRSAEDCRGCNIYIDLFDQVYGAGGRYTGGAQTLSDISASSLETGDVVLVRATTTLAKGTAQETADGRVEQIGSSSAKVIYRVERSGAGWVMAAYASEE